MRAASSSTTSSPATFFSTATFSLLSSFVSDVRLLIRAGASSSDPPSPDPASAIMSSSTMSSAITPLRTVFPDSPSAGIASFSFFCSSSLDLDSSSIRGFSSKREESSSPNRASFREASVEPFKDSSVSSDGSVSVSSSSNSSCRISFLSISSCSFERVPIWPVPYDIPARGSDAGYEIFRRVMVRGSLPGENAPARVVPAKGSAAPTAPLPCV